MAKKNNPEMQSEVLGTAALQQEEAAVVAEGAETAESPTVEPAAQQDTATETTPATAEAAAADLRQVSYPTGLNLRKAPGKAAAIVAVLPRGMVVEAVGDWYSLNGEEWLAVSTSKGNGWVASQYLDEYVPDSD